MKKLTQKEAVEIQKFIDKVDAEGLGYASLVYPPGPAAPKDLRDGVINVHRAINELSRLINYYEENLP